MSRPLRHYDEQIDPVEDDINPNQTWQCERCSVWTPDPSWRDGQVVCSACQYAAQFKPAEDDIECPF